MSWLEIIKTARPWYTAYKCWEEAHWKAELKKMVGLPPSPAWFSELKGPSGEVLLCLHPPQGPGAGPWCTPVADAQSLQAGPPFFLRRKGKSGEVPTETICQFFVDILPCCRYQPKMGHCVLKQTSRKYFIFLRQAKKACHHRVHFYYLKGH